MTTPPTTRLTRAVRAGIDTDPSEGAVIPPLHLSSTYSFTGFDEPRRYDYSRCGNPTRDVLGEALATLEGGHGATVTPSGLAAVTLVCSLLLGPEDTVLVAHDCYGGSWRLFDTLAARGHLRYRTVALGDLAAVEAALAGPTPPAAVWLETPSNPLLRITDIAAVSALAHRAGAQVVVDNTFLSPVLQRPFEHGADLVVHSTTKFINGHSDVVGGAVVARTASQHEALQDLANVLGLVGSPFDAYQTLRGLRTLHTRLRAHDENAQALLGVVLGHPAVAAVHHPSLPDHPGHAVAARQQDGFGSMLSVDLAGGVPAVRAFVDGLRCLTLAESLGGTESLVAHPATMTHASMTPEARAAAGIGEGLLRLSVGIEHPDDLRADVRAALDRAVAAAG
ncbi:cystathionine gamma-synthase [Ornithinimicrobium pekingense]|uniref:Cystathionine gamma-synthase n=1 Tax=Ornithinimicrobium pekingense TaxID=384677 RepID=A0ABQ2F9E5_9MICO|nr:cystathionine gamma-synthase [Ornithinimicrobium pekingense]GGK72528.1 cystathionine gamma-synthase [Ornithinimicrobium pekingense]